MGMGSPLPKYSALNLANHVSIHDVVTIILVTFSVRADTFLPLAKGLLVGVGGIILRPIHQKELLRGTGHRRVKPMVIVRGKHFVGHISMVHIDMGPLPALRLMAGDGIGKLYLQRVKVRSEEHTSELQSRQYLVCRLLL